MRLGDLKLDNPFVQAPLAGITDPPFRTIARRFHDGLIFSEMISAEALCRRNRRTESYFKIEEGHHPIALQIEGNDPSRLAEAAKFIEDLGADVVDINAGCPEAKLLKAGAGGGLLKDLHKLVMTAKAVAKAVTIPVSVKTRLGYDSDISLKVLKALSETGITFITFNGYTVKQKFSGTSDWEALQRLATEARDIGIPLIANGGARSEAKAVEMLKVTGASGVMIGRATRGRPDLPGTAFSLHRSGAFSRMGPEVLASTIHDHAVLELDLYGPDKGIKRMRKNVTWYLKAARYASDASQVNSISTLPALDKLVEKVISHGPRPQ